MSAPESVLGVLAVCRVVLPTLHSRRPRGSWAAWVVCKVCKVQARARACMNKISSLSAARVVPGGFFSTRGLKKPYQPYTPYTGALKPLVLLVFSCVRVVLGLPILCWVGSADGETGHD